MTLLFLAEPGLSATRCSGLGLKRPERNARRWRLWFCQWIYEEKAPRHALCRFATHVETRSAPNSVLRNTARRLAHDGSIGLAVDFKGGAFWRTRSRRAGGQGSAEY